MQSHLMCPLLETPVFDRSKCQVQGKIIHLCNVTVQIGVLGLTWQYVFISVLLDILLPLSCVGGVDLLRPVFS